MTEDLEARLRATLATRAASITATDLARPAVGDVPLHAPATEARGAAPRRIFAVAAALFLVVGAVGAVVLTRRPSTGDTPVLAGPAPRVAAAEAAGERAWPLTSDDPLPTPTTERPQTPDVVAGAYLTEVVGLPAGWPVHDLTEQDGTAVVEYVLQDVPATLRLARSDEGAWFVTGATTELARPSVVAAVASNVDVSIAPGPRTYDGGVRVRLSALAADGSVLGVATSTATPPAPGAAAAAAVVPIRWRGAEVAAVVRADVVDDHDGDAATPDVIVGHWTASVATPSTASLPAGFDVLSAEAVFSGVGGADDVAGAYLRSRFPDYPSPGVRAEPAQTRARRAFVRWAVEDGIAAGTLFLRDDGGSWKVVASTIDGVDLSDVAIEHGRARGTVTTTNINSLYADVLRPDGSPVPASPRPEGRPEAAYRFATAAGPANGTLELEVPVEGETPVLRVGLVGGTILAVAECRLG